MFPCYKLIKIVVDKVIALILLVILSPVFLVISLILTLSGSKVLSKQERVGLLGHSFTLFKFKTMHDNECQAESDRITKTGNFLRKTALDELPQIWNVLKGDMSFIGPRPLLVEYLPLYSIRHQKRHWVMPGITGLAQVNGRNDLSWEEKFELDVTYQESFSFWLDLKVGLKTIIYLFGNNSGTQLAEKFTGYNNQVN